MDNGTGGNDESDELAKIPVKLDDYGGVEGEWKIPATAKAAHMSHAGIRWRELRGAFRRTGIPPAAVHGDAR